MKQRLAIALLVAGALALACGPHARHNDVSASTGEPSARLTSGKTQHSHSLASSAKVAVGDKGIALALHVTNVGNHALEITFPSGLTHDFIIQDSIGRDVWKWSDGRLFTQALQNKLLDANETLSFDEKWSGPHKRGRYTAIAVLNSTNHPVEERVEFTVP